jgi:hypothetical protein
MQVRRARWWVLVWVAATFFAASLSDLFASAASADEVYVANLTAPKGLGKKTAQLRLTIRERTSEEERATLGKILREQSSEAAFAAVRKIEHGTANIIGGVESPINYFYVFPGQNGARAIIIMAHPLYFPEDTPDVIPQGPVGLISLSLSNAGKGRGTMAEAEKVSVTDSGTFEVEGQATQIDLEDVVRVR